ncbi:MAG: hypothetical protein IE916_07145 [Epsilonproteobacteria bacterium]|nr:hypothetical protein [Campylobacterota bacterium]
MRRNTIALIAALLIHLLFIAFFFLFGMMIPTATPQNIDDEKRFKVSLKELPPKPKEPGKKEKSEPQPPQHSVMPKGAQLEKLIDQPLIKHEPQSTPRPVYMNPPENVPMESVMEVEPVTEVKKPLITLEKSTKELNTTKPKEKSDPLYALLSQDHSDNEPQQEKRTTASGSSINQNIKELYGEEFGKLTPGQQQYILDNQEVMRRITQQVLNRVARVNIPHDLSVNRTNVIEFYLHPNGDMSDFKFLSSSGYYVLDDTTKETIEYAYSRYPRPSEKILIRYNVYYNLARY